jgi:hypothetical protein
MTTPTPTLSMPETRPTHASTIESGEVSIVLVWFPIDTGVVICVAKLNGFFLLRILTIMVGRFNFML